jgi:hypothetical protein
MAHDGTLQRFAPGGHSAAVDPNVALPNHKRYMIPLAVDSAQGLIHIHWGTGSSSSRTGASAG